MINKAWFFTIKYKRIKVRSRLLVGDFSHLSATVCYLLKEVFSTKDIIYFFIYQKKKSMHVRLFGKVGHLLHYTTLYGSWDVQLEATFFNKRKESN